MVAWMRARTQLWWSKNAEKSQGQAKIHFPGQLREDIGKPFRGWESNDANYCLVFSPSHFTFAAAKAAMIRTQESRPGSGSRRKFTNIFAYRCLLLGQGSILPMNVIPRETLTNVRWGCNGKH